MKRKKVNKAEKVVKKELPKEEPRKAHPLQAWDNLMFIKRKPLSEEDNTKE